MDGHAEKFSFCERELTALEAAFQSLMAFDATSQERGADRRMRAGLLAERRCEHGGAGVEPSTDARGQSSDLSEDARTLAGVARDGFRESALLQIVLASIEVLTARPYAEHGEEAAQIELDDAARRRAMRPVCGLLGNADCIEDTCAQALKAAEESHSTFWKKALVIGGGGVLALLAGVFAGPLIGGLVGTWVLGLSGAAAVSAGLALLGGGALAAGGFGMVGGTVVIAGAFGAAGAGGASAFLADDGEIGAKLAAIKSQAAFEALLALDLLDHVLAQDFIDAFERQATEHEAAGESGTVHAKQAKEASPTRSCTWLVPGTSMCSGSWGLGP